MNHYVYRITNTIENIHYYGVRSCIGDPRFDIGVKYFSSSSDKNFIKLQKNNPEYFKYKVVKIFSSRKDACKMEVKLHHMFDVGVSEAFYNKCKQTTYGHDQTGVRRTPEQVENLAKSTRGTVVVQDRDGNCFRVKKTDPRYISGELYNPLRGKPKSDQHRANISLSWKNRVVTDETRAKMSKSRKGVPKSKAHIEKLSGANHHNTKRISIFDSTGNLMYVCESGFKSFCKKHGLPFDSLVRSYQSNGCPLYQKLGKSDITRLKNTNRIQFVGWFAMITPP